MDIKPSIIEYADYVRSGCSYWRSRGVLAELKRQGEINLIGGTWKDTWDVLRLVHIAFFQRPMSKKCKDQVFRCKDMGLKIWIDLDDYADIPEDHPVYDLYKKEFNEKVFSEVIDTADIVTVSTEYLKNYYLRYSNNIKVVPNAINDYIFKIHPVNNNKRIFIRLGDHHESDMYAFKDSIIKIMKKYPDWQLMTGGSSPIFLNKEISNYMYMGDFEIMDYFKLINHIKASIFVIPLKDNDFNKAKSNIGWQESTMSGAVAVTPYFYGMEEESSVYYDESSMFKAIERLIKNADLRKKLYDKSVKRLKENHLLSNVNKQRLNIIKNLMK